MSTNKRGAPVTTEFQPNELAKELGLTPKQQSFCDLFLFVSGLDGIKAFELSEYNLKDKKPSEDAPQQEKYYYDMQVRREVRNLLGNLKIQKYIKAVRENLDLQLNVDRLWVLNKLKELATKGSERTQLEATKLLGQNLSMFTEVQKVEVVDDAGSIAKKAFEERIKKQKEQNNTIPFPSQVSNG